MRLDAGSADAVWAVDAEGISGRSLIQVAPTRVTFPLRLDASVALRGTVMLAPHDWREGTGAVRVRVRVIGSNGHSRELWSGRLATAAAHGTPEALPLECELPADTTAVILDVRRRHGRNPRAVERVMWIDLAIDGPGIASAGREVPIRPAGAPRTGGPLISILTPVHDPPLAMLEEAIGSVLAQTTGHWELWLIDDGSRDPQIIAALQRHAAGDSRVHLLRRTTAGGISVATNAGLELAGGEYVALLDHDDTLDPRAIELVRNRLTADPGLDMVYTDEDIVMDGRRVWVHVKPGWSPDVLRTNGYTCHLGVYRTALLRELGAFRPEFDGSQDVDMILRLTERTDRIANVPEILYHWRAHASSTAGSDAKPYAYVSARRAIDAHLRRLRIDAEVDFGPPGLYRVVHRVPKTSTVALTLAVSEADGLREAARSWSEQSHPSWEVVLAAPPECLEACTTALIDGGVETARISTVALAPGASSAAGLAAAAALARTEHLLLMQAPCVGLTHDWLRRLLGYSGQDGIAAAGPVVLAPDGRVAHAGIAVPQGIPLYLLHGRRTSMDELFGFGTSVYNLSAVSGVLATRRGRYEDLGGLDPELGELSLIDYCLRASAAGERIVTVPDARLRTIGADHTGNDLPRLAELRRRWAANRGGDSYYSPSYRPDRGDFALREGIL
jgi:GT2 family glycosyltransferase